VGSDFVHAKLFSQSLELILDLEDVGDDLLAFSKQSVRPRHVESDVMAAYALAHEHGRNFEVDLLVQVAKSASAVGDCE
jgi:hypothetical protein